MPQIERLGRFQVARAVYDFAVDGGAVAAHIAKSPMALLPLNAIVVGGFVHVITTCVTAGADAGTMAIHVNGANDIVTAIAVSDGTNPWDAGLHAIIPKANTPEATGIICTAARAVTFTIAVQAFTAGKIVVFLYWVDSEAA